MCNEEQGAQEVSRVCILGPACAFCTVVGQLKFCEVRTIGTLENDFIVCFAKNYCTLYALLSDVEFALVATKHVRTIKL